MTREHAGDYDYWVIEVSSYTGDRPGGHPAGHRGDVAAPRPPALARRRRAVLPRQAVRDAPSRARTSPSPTATATCSASGPACSAPRVEWVGEADDPGATWMDPLGLPGRHNRRNALIARAVLRALGAAAGDERLAGRAADDAAAARRAAAGFTPLPQPPHPGRHGRRGHVHRRLAVHQRAADAGRPRLLPRPAGRAHRRRPGPRHRLRRRWRTGVRRRAEPTLVLTLPDSGPRITAAFAAAASRRRTAGFAGIRDCADLDEAVAARLRLGAARRHRAAVPRGPELRPLPRLPRPGRPLRGRDARPRPQQLTAARPSVRDRDAQVMGEQRREGHQLQRVDPGAAQAVVAGLDARRRRRTRAARPAGRRPCSWRG